MLDARVFRSKAVDPETLAFVKGVEEMLAGVPPVHTIPVEVTRGMRESGRGAFGPIVRLDSAKDIGIEGPAGKVRLRTFVPERVDGVYLHIHGGGWTLGAADMQDPSLDALSKAANVAVVSVEYRLAPEHPYPGGPDDCEAAALWLVKNAKWEFGTDRLVIGGESAGGHLSAVTLLRLRDKHGFSGFSGAALTYGCYDLSMTPSVARWGERNLILSGPIMDWFFKNFVPSGDPRDPDVSPLYADLSGMPPALFTVGTFDPLLDDNLFMYSRWLAAGNDAELAVYPGGIHAFDMFPNRMGAQARARVHAFVQQAVGARQEAGAATS